MAKVFAVILEDQDLVLKTWSSAKLFNKTESWLDDKFICIATSDDFKGNNSFPPRGVFDDEIIEGEVSFFIRTQNEIAAHNIMHDARNNYMGLSKL
jgi:hypothetical protein